MTEAEDRLWHELRDRRLDRIKFRRQVPVGKYVADFACLEARLIVEIDGSQHADSDSDQARKTELEARGFRVLRFWNDDVLRFGQRLQYDHRLCKGCQFETMAVKEPPASSWNTPCICTEETLCDGSD